MQGRNSVQWDVIAAIIPRWISGEAKSITTLGGVRWHSLAAWRELANAISASPDAELRRPKPPRLTDHLTRPFKVFLPPSVIHDRPRGAFGRGIQAHLIERQRFEAELPRRRIRAQAIVAPLDVHELRVSGYGM